MNSEPTLTPETFVALDRAVEAGGTSLPIATVAGRGGKAGTAFLEPLLAAGWFVKQGTKYWLTPQGRALWERHAPTERLATIREREAAAQRERLLAFLQLLEKKKGKLTAPEAKKWTTTIDEALKSHVTRGEKANTFVVTPAGEAVLLAAKPATEQLEVLRQLHASLATRWQALQQHWHSAIESASLRPAGNHITEQANAALIALERSTAAAAAFDDLAQTAQAVRQELDAERVKAQEAQQQLQDAIQKQRDELATLERDLTARLALLEHLPAVPAPTPSVDSWTSMQTAYQDLAERASKLGGIVKIPELADAVLANTSMTREAFQQQLLLWEREDRLTLQVCNDRHLEARAAEGIESPRGLLFYVRLK